MKHLLLTTAVALFVAAGTTAFAHDGHSDPSPSDPSDSSPQYLETLTGGPDHNAVDHRYTNHYHTGSNSAMNPDGPAPSPAAASGGDGEVVKLGCVSEVACASRNN